ncbi:MULTISPECIES: hypothetical protein [unclassified Mesorhizobium]|uniref:hypothetical protein n=1 Tax=unclassified Mesorhizobium TaxID=325217 RepID=UPI00112B7343|nr:MULTISPECIES: hypothetical protein [unclassified Mesorhizobium]TPJ86935.1 hypothetical protein FJ489_30745 [Mesorhizobium sp. B2-5-12]TPK19158.1 hypothetical protein FJ562_31150 [Mesorhizobium sp. B2-5-6]
MLTTPGIGHNQPPDPIDEALTAIHDLYDEALNFADGAAIDSEAMHDTVTALRDAIHEAGKAADALRVEAKRPLDEQIAAIQERFNPAIQPKKGMVDRAKASLGELLAAWRKQEADKKAAIAAAARLEAERIAKEAQDAIRASAGNLAAREEAEALLVEAKQAEKQAKRDDKAATSGLGLRTVWRAELVDVEKALDWCYGRDPDAFRALCQSQADTVVRAGMRSVPGFRVFEDKIV